MPPGALLIGQPVSALDVRVVSLRRSGGRVVGIESDPTMESGDTLVLSGQIEKLAAAVQKLLKV